MTKRMTTTAGNTPKAEDFTQEELKAACAYVEHVYDLGSQLYGGDDSFIPSFADDIRKLNRIKELGLKVYTDMGTTEAEDEELKDLLTNMDPYGIPK